MKHFLITDCCERAQAIVGGTTPGQVVLGSIRKQAKEAMRGKSMSNNFSWPLYQILPPGSCLVGVPILASFNDGLYNMEV